GAHQWTFAAVPITAGAEDTEQPPGADPAQRRQRGDDRVRLVRIVDDTQHRPRRAHHLQPPGHPTAGGNAVGGDVWGNPHLTEAPQSEQPVWGVVVSLHAAPT